jgi:hypothetical protein
MTNITTINKTFALWTDQFGIGIELCDLALTCLTQPNLPLPTLTYPYLTFPYLTLTSLT